MMLDTDHPQRDGRRLRAEASRRRIVAALMTLIQKGQTTPTAEAVAEESNVGLRTVFRHFADMEALHREIALEVSARLLPKTAEPFRAADPSGRLVELLDRRALLFEELLPFKRAGDAHAARSPGIQKEHQAIARFQRAMLVSLLPPAFRAQRDRVEALDLAMSLDSWKRLRTEQSLSPRRARAVMGLAVLAIWRGFED